MRKTTEFNIDEETIQMLGLRITNEPINAQIAPNARVFEHPDLKNVFVMESDLYGNVMPKDTCFLAFNGRNGLMGKHLKIDTLKSESVSTIRNMIESNTEG
jgi:hypothetical protein